MGPSTVQYRHWRSLAEYFATQLYTLLHSFILNSQKMSATVRRARRRQVTSPRTWDGTRAGIPIQATIFLSKSAGSFGYCHNLGLPGMAPRLAYPFRRRYFIPRAPVHLGIASTWATNWFYQGWHKGWHYGWHTHSGVGISFQRRR